MFQSNRLFVLVSLVASLLTGCGNGKCDPNLPDPHHTCPDSSEVAETMAADEAPTEATADPEGDDDTEQGDDVGDDTPSVDSPAPDVESTPLVEVETPTPAEDDITPVAITPIPEVDETPVQVTPTPEDEETATPLVESTPEVPTATPPVEETPEAVSPTPPVEDGDDDASTPSPAPTEPPGEEWVETDIDGDGYLVSEGDCVEGDATTYPGAVELQDWVDNDCDGSIDDGCSSACQWDYESYQSGLGYCRDDLYTFWASASTDFTWECTGSTWYVQLDVDQDGYDSTVDCNDANAAIYPGASEKMNWVDDDCNGLVDDGCNVSCNWDYVSVDPSSGTQCRDDLYTFWASGNTNLTWECTGDAWRVEVDVDADGYVASTGDCSEGDPDTYPGAPELMDWIDNDCNGVDDNGCSTSCGWDYVSIAEDGTQCRDDLYAFWLSESYDWRCTGTTWRASP